MKKNVLSEILRLHKLWLMDDPNGVRANLNSANLKYANLCNADLSGANLSNADLSYTNLIYANLSSADLSCANLESADLSCTNLNNANLNGAKNLHTVFYNELTAFFSLQCPESGSYRGYKKAQGLIVELEITEDALRSSATSRKCRASKARVISITDIKGNSAREFIRSNYDSGFIYIVGEIIEVKDFDMNRWKECSTGIHHFITRREAVLY